MDDKPLGKPPSNSGKGQDDRARGSTPSHTPGPWQVEGGGFVGGPVGYGRICQTWNKFEEDFKNAEGNARLIAAAPELLAALKTARSVLTVACGTDAPYIRVALSTIDAAIAKAEGR